MRNGDRCGGYGRKPRTCLSARDGLTVHRQDSPHVLRAMRRAERADPNPRATLRPRDRIHKAGRARVLIREKKPVTAGPAAGGPGADRFRYSSRASAGISAPGNDKDPPGHDQHALRRSLVARTCNPAGVGDVGVEPSGETSSTRRIGFEEPDDPARECRRVSGRRAPHIGSRSLPRDILISLVQRGSNRKSIWAG
jgi:hypothetical protein